MGEDWASAEGRARLRGLLADEARLLDEYQSQADRDSPKAIRLWSEHDEVDALLEQARYEALGPLLDALDAADLSLSHEIREHEAAQAAARAAVTRQPCGHPGACVASSDEGSSYCRWCEEVARLTADLAAPGYSAKAETRIAALEARVAALEGGALREARGLIERFLGQPYGYGESTEADAKAWLAKHDAALRGEGGGHG